MVVVAERDPELVGDRPCVESESSPERLARDAQLGRAEVGQDLEELLEDDRVEMDVEVAVHVPVHPAVGQSGGRSRQERVRR